MPAQKRLSYNDYYHAATDFVCLQGKLARRVVYTSVVAVERSDVTVFDAEQDGGAGLGDREVSTMSLLKDSVSKLRAAHLMDGRNPRALPVDTMSDTSGDEAYVRHSRKPIAGSCMVRTGMSNECGGYRPCNGCDSQHSDTSYARCSLRRHAAYDKGHGDGLVKAPQPQTSSAGRRRTYYRAHARSAVSEEPRQPRYVGIRYR